MPWDGGGFGIGVGSFGVGGFGKGVLVEDGDDDDDDDANGDVVGARGSDAAAEYDSGYEDVAVRGIVEISRWVARRARGSFAPCCGAPFEGEDQKDGRRGKYAVHDDEEEEEEEEEQEA